MADGRGEPEARRVVRGIVGALLTASLMPLNSTMVAVAVPAIGRQFDEAPDRVTQALVASYLIAAIALQGPGGKLGDRRGHWRMFTLGQLTISLGAVLGLLAPDLVLLAAARVLMAAGGAIAVPATVAVLRLELSPQRRGRAFGAFGATMALAAAIGPLVGGVLVDAFGWRTVFLVNIPVLLVSAALAASVAHPETPVSAVAFDWVGSGLLTTGLALVVLAAQGSDLPTLPLLLVGGTTLLLLGVWERRVADPVIAFDLFRSAAFSCGTVLTAVQNLVMYALLFEVPLLLSALLGVGGQETGRVLLSLTAAMVLTSLVAGRLTDRFGARPLAVVGSLTCLGAVAMLAASPMTSAASFAWPLAVLGAGLGLSGPAAQTASLSAVAGGRSGMAAGVSSQMRYLGGVAGIAVLGSLLQLSGDREVVVDTHHLVLVVFAGALVVGLVCALALPGAPVRGGAGRPRQDSNL